MLNHHFTRISPQPASSTVTQENVFLPIDQEKSKKQGTRIWRSLNTEDVIVLYKLASSQLSQFQVTFKAVVPKHWNRLGILIPSFHPTYSDLINMGTTWASGF